MRLRTSAFWKRMLAPGALSVVLLSQSVTSAEPTSDQPDSVQNGKIKLVQQETAPAQPAPAATPNQPAQPSAPSSGGGTRGVPSFTKPTADTATPSASVAAPSIQNDTIGGGQAQTRTGGDAGTLIASSPSVTGVGLQRRNPIITDARIRGFHIGQLPTFLDGGYFFPARQDIDTIASKIDPSNIDNITIVKGPYDVRHGPGFAFIIVDTLETPRYKDGFEIHGSTQMNYKSNGSQIQGRQAIWGGDKDYGFRLGYDIKSGNDYETGAGFKEPSSYRSQNIDFAVGFQLSCDSHIEFHGLRQDLYNVELPGQDSVCG